MKNTLIRSVAKPFVRFKNNFAFEINNEFERLTGYLRTDLLGKSISEIINILKIDTQVNLKDIESEYSCYIFTKEYEPREVTISCKRIQHENDQIYYIKEKRNSRIEDRIPYVVSIIEDNDVGVAIYSISDGILLKLNEKFLNFSKISHEKIENCIGKKWDEIFSHKKKYYESVYLNIIKNGKPFHLKEIKWNSPREGDTYWNLSFVPIIIKGEKKYLVQTVTDVTERIVSRNIIEKQKQELEVIIENISDQLILFNKNGEYIKMNKLARDKAMFNIKTAKNFNEAYEEVKIYDMYDNLLLVEDVPLKRVIRGETFTNVRVIRKNSEYTQYTSISGTPIYDDEGNFFAGVLVMRDITDEVKYEENLYIKAQYDSLSSIINNLDLGFIRLTYPELNFIDLNNKAYYQLKQINPNMDSQTFIKGQNLYDVFLGEAHMKELLHNSLKNNSCFEIRNFNIDGEDLFCKYIYQPLYGLNNEIVEILVFWIDITEEEKARTILEDTLKMQEEIYSNVAHELKTPLNVIFSANQLLLMYLKNDLYEENKGKFYIYSNSIKQNCYRLTKLINNIVDLSKSQAGYFKLNLSNENIVEIIENIAESVSDYVKSRELRIVFYSNVEEKIIACDPIRIERVMLNLISNAIKFSNPSGEIYINVLDKKDTVEISVKDTGVGIEKEHLDLLFKKFYQIDKTLSRNAEGSGIGLSLTKSIVDLHGGNIIVESESGKGSTFKVELPARTIEHKKAKEQTNDINNKIEMINIEFSDIYAND